MGTYICEVFCSSFWQGGISVHVHMRCYFQVCLIQSSIGDHHSDLVLYFLFKQVPIFVTDLLYTFQVFEVCGSFRMWESPILLSLVGTCKVLFGASHMSCVQAIPSALYTQTSWPLLYVGKVVILHHL